MGCCRRHRVGIGGGRQALADAQRFAHHRLVRRLRGIDAENKIAAGLIDLVVEFNREFESEHVALPVGFRCPRTGLRRALESCRPTGSIRFALFTDCLLTH